MKFNILNFSVTLFGKSMEITIPMIVGVILLVLIIVAVIGAFVNSSIQMKVSLLMDSETRVYNRQGLHKLLKKNKKYINGGILGYIEIKNLDRLYDFYPDKSMLMYKIANLIISNLEKKDLIARVDFNEFVIAFMNGTQDEIKAVMKDINEAFLSYEILDYGTFPFDIEYGIYDTISLKEEAKELDKKEDIVGLAITRCMDVTKYSQNKEGNIYIYSDEVRSTENQINTIVGARDEAFENKQFINVYTPKVSFKTGKIVGAEVRVQWKNAEGQEVFSSKDFDSVFEHSSFIKKLDYEMLKHALDYLKNNNLSMNPEYSLTLKMSIFDFESREFVESVKQLLSSSAVAANHIEIALSDNQSYLTANEFVKIIDQIKAIGFKIAVNNMGKDKVSLAGLVLGNFNSIFLDEIYTVGNLESDRDQVFFRNSIEMLELSTENVVVRGVNNEETLKEIAKVTKDVILEGSYFGSNLREHEFTSLSNKTYKFTYPDPLKYVLETDLVIKNAQIQNAQGLPQNTTINLHQDNSEIAELRKQMEEMRRGFEEKLYLEREKTHQMEIDNLKKQIEAANNRNQQMQQPGFDPYSYHLNNEIYELRKQIMELKGTKEDAASNDVNYLKAEVERLKNERAKESEAEDVSYLKSELERMKREKAAESNANYDDLQKQIRELKESQSKQPQLDVDLIIDRIRGNQELNQYLSDSRREREELRNSLEQERKEREELEKMIAELNQEEDEEEVDEDTILKDQELANQNVNLDIESLSDDETDEDDEEEEDEEETKNLQKPNLTLDEVEAVIESYKRKYNENWNVKAKEELKDGYYEIVNGLLYYRGRQNKNLAERIKSANSDVKHLYNIIKNELMQYNDARYKITNKFDSVYVNKKLVAKLSLTKRKVRLYMNLDPSEYSLTQFPHRDVSNKKVHVKTPYLMFVKSQLSVRRAKTLIADLMLKNNSRINGDYKPVDYANMFKYYSRNKNNSFLKG